MKKGEREKPQLHCTYYNGEWIVETNRPIQKIAVNDLERLFSSLIQTLKEITIHGKEQS